MSRKIVCTINNQTTGQIQYSSNSTTGGSFSSKSNYVNPGASIEVFEADGPSAWVSGCGGVVTYTLPNSVDKLVITYNVSTTGDSAQTFAALQNISGSHAGSDSYFIVVHPGSVVGTSLSPTVSVYPSSATGITGPGTVVDAASFVLINIDNQLDTWLTLNGFANPTWDIMPIVTDGTSSIAPGTTATVLTSAGAYKFQLVYNVNSSTLLTVTQDETDSPTAGFNVSCPFDVAVTGSGSTSKGFSYTVTISPATTAEVMRRARELERE